MKSPRLGYVILLDALRHDFIDPDRTPFLASLKQRARSATVIETFAFQTRPSYFAGLEPEESNICHLFEFNPEASPFVFLRPLAPLANLVERIGGDRVCRGVVRRIARQVEKHRGNRAAAAVMGTEQIPLHLLPLFALSEKRHTDEPGVFSQHPTFFDRLRQHHLTWSWIGYPRHFGSTAEILRAFAEAPETDVAYLHFSELDWIGHRYGPQAPELLRALTMIDETMRELLSGELVRGKRAVIFGDHGMVEVTTHLDVEAHLRQLPLTAGVDYHYFLDSTQVRFWFNSAQARHTVLQSLKALPLGHILTPTERESLRIRFQDRRYGDDIFMLDAPAVIHPSFFARRGSPPKGMHGYLPAMRENATQVLAVGPWEASQEQEAIPMTRIFKILCEAFSLTEAPAGAKGATQAS